MLNDILYNIGVFLKEKNNEIEIITFNEDTLHFLSEDWSILDSLMLRWDIKNISEIIYEYFEINKYKDWVSKKWCLTLILKDKNIDLQNLYGLLILKAS